jgi:hypothetical protein
VQARSPDTDAAAERVQVGLLRAAGATRRLCLALSLSDSVLGLARRAVRRSDDEAGALEARLAFVDLHYGRDIREALRRDLAARSR